MLRCQKHGIVKHHIGATCEICTSEKAEVLKSAHNSNYAAAQAAYNEWRTSTCDSDMLSFMGWLDTRLNAEQHCA